MTNMRDWLDEGGRGVLATHYHYTWFKDGPANGCTNCTDFVNTATWLGTSPGIGTGTYSIDQTFARGLARPDNGLEGRTRRALRRLPLAGVADSVSTVSAAAQRWIYDEASGDTKAMTILTPIGGADAGASYCGKAVFSDVHAGGSSIGAGAVPGSCGAPTTRTPQQAALEFLFFDLSSCVSDETMPPPPPPASQ